MMIVSFTPGVPPTPLPPLHTPEAALQFPVEVAVAVLAFTDKINWNKKEKRSKNNFIPAIE